MSSRASTGSGEINSISDLFQGVYLTYIVIGACLIALLITFNMCVLHFRAKNEAYMRRKQAANGGRRSNHQTNSSFFTGTIGFGAKADDVDKSNPDLINELPTPSMLERANTPTPLVIRKQGSDLDKEEELFAVITTEKPSILAKGSGMKADAKKSSFLPEANSSMIGAKSPGSLGQLNIISRSDSRKGSRETINSPEIRRSPSYPSSGNFNELGSKKKSISKLTISDN